MEKLMSYDWPGNMRELENSITRAAALAVNGGIKPDDIMFVSPGIRKITMISRPSGKLPESGTLEESLKKRIEDALYDNDWNLSQTAVKLGIGRTTLWRKMKKLGIL